MAMLLAPYNNSLRLGQGFNSYTQQICLEGAVKPQPKSWQDGDDVKEQDRNELKKSQIVSYSSRFVEKLSDVTDAMNISASLSIKTAQVGGKVSGTYIDSDKFKESDLNYFLQVKVTNQTHMAEDYTEFQKIDNVAPNDFPAVYGDCFIAGFEEGGELNALISIKVADKSKTFNIKGELEATLGTPALTGEVTGKVDLEKAENKTSTETTVTVNWSGGGQIKESGVLWDVNSLQLAAANFPDFVAQTPQRTYAILKKYTTLPSFHQKMSGYSILDYETAGIHTSALLDTYTDYKAIWKQIQLASFELQNQRVIMKEAQLPPDILELKTQQKALHSSNQHTSDAKSPLGLLPTPPTPSQAAASTPNTETSSTTAPTQTPPGENTNGTAGSVANIPPTMTPAATEAVQPKRKKKRYVYSALAYEPYAPTIVGLEKARRDCRMEMSKIVNEVDEITDDPELAQDPLRDANIMSSSIFRRLLPIVTLKPPEIRPDLTTAVMGEQSLLLGVPSDEDIKTLRIVLAVYGVHEVTDAVRKLVTYDQTLRFPLSNLDSALSDPKFYTGFKDTFKKTLSVIFQYDDGPMHICNVRAESADANPQVIASRYGIQHPVVPAYPKNSDSLCILAAVYGGQLITEEATLKRLESQAQLSPNSGTRTIEVTSSNFGGDTWLGNRKTGLIFYKASMRSGIKCAAGIEAFSPCVISDRLILSANTLKQIDHKPFPWHFNFGGTPGNIYLSLFFRKDDGFKMTAGPESRIQLSSAAFELLEDGNFFARDDEMTLNYSTGTTKAGLKGSDIQLSFEPTGNLVLYHSDDIVWQSDTASRGSILKFFSGSPYMVIYGLRKAVWRLPWIGAPDLEHIADL